MRRAPITSGGSAVTELDAAAIAESGRPLVALGSEAQRECSGAARCVLGTSVARLGPGTDSMGRHGGRRDEKCGEESDHF